MNNKNTFKCRYDKDGRCTNLKECKHQIFCINADECAISPFESELEKKKREFKELIETQVGVKNG